MITDIKQFFLLILMTMTGVFGACSSDDDENYDFNISELNVPTEQIAFAKKGGEKVVNVQSSQAIHAESDATWCTTTVGQTSAALKVTPITISCAANDTDGERNALITITSGSSTATISIEQSAELVVTAIEPAGVIPAEGGKVTVSLKYDKTPVVTLGDNCLGWIKQVEVKAMQTGNILFEVAPNYGEARQGDITLTVNDVEELITIEQAAGEIPSDGMDSDAKTLVSKIYAGWNLGNTLEATGGETAWGNPAATLELIEYVKSQGFNAVRIPCSWHQYASDGVIDNKWMMRVKEVVDYVVESDMYAILNIHWDGGWLENNCTPDKQESVNALQREYWTQIATTFRDYDEHLLFAGCNEPNVENAEQMAVLKAYEQTFVDAVRATGGRNAKRCLIVQGPSTNFDKTISLFTMPTDIVADRLILEVHYYDPWQFCGLEADADWGKMFYFWGADNHVSGSDRNCTWGEEDELNAAFKKMKTNFADKGIPMILGEYGAMFRTSLTGSDWDAHHQSVADFNYLCTREAKNAGMAPFYWDGGTFALINRRDLALGSSLVMEAINRGAQEGNYPF